MGKTKKKIIFVVIAFIMVCAALLAVYGFMFDPHRGTLTGNIETLPLESALSRDQAKEDIDYVMSMLRSRHPAWLEEDNERVAAVEAQYLAELGVLNEKYPDGMTVLDEWKLIGRIMHELYDGHSGVRCHYSEYRFINDFSQISEYGPPVRINGEPTEDVFERFLSVRQYETVESAKTSFLSSALYNDVFLSLAGVDTRDGVTYTFDTGDGEIDFHYSYVPIADVAGKDSPSDDEKRVMNSWVGYSIDYKNQIGVFTLTECNYDDQYKSTVKEFFNAVSEADVKDVIVDLRGNGGGSSGVGNEFITYLDVDGYYEWADHVRLGNYLLKHKREYIKNRRSNPVFSGNVYVLTNTGTYSSAMDFTMLIMDNDIGKVVGEASGNLPDSYGDFLNFAMPNSKLLFTVSYKRWFRIDESKAGQLLEPDYPCDPNEALEKAYEIILSGRD